MEITNLNSNNRITHTHMHTSECNDSEVSLPTAAVSHLTNKASLPGKEIKKKKQGACVNWFGRRITASSSAKTLIISGAVAAGRVAPRYPESLYCKCHRCEIRPELRKCEHYRLFFFTWMFWSCGLEFYPAGKYCCV